MDGNAGGEHLGPRILRGTTTETGGTGPPQNARTYDRQAFDSSRVRELLDRIQERLRGEGIIVAAMVWQSDVFWTMCTDCEEGFDCISCVCGEEGL